MCHIEAQASEVLRSETALLLRKSLCAKLIMEPLRFGHPARGPSLPRTIDELVALFDLERLDDNSFRGHCPPGSALTHVYGGQLLAQALRAAVDTVDEHKQAHSAHGHFLRTGDIRKPLVYEVERTREGRSFASRRVVVTQKDDPIFHLTVSFHRPEHGYEHAPEPPAISSPTNSIPLRDAMSHVEPAIAEVWNTEWSAFEVLFTDGAQEFMQGGIPSMQGVWVRPSGAFPDDPILRTCLVAYLSDLGLLSSCLAPHGFPMWAPGVPRASLDHTIWFHKSSEKPGWMLFEQSSEWAGGGRGLARGRVFDSEGNLLASMAQEGLIRPSR